MGEEKEYSRSADLVFTLEREITSGTFFGG